jgi:hypothetical protein
MTNNNNGSDVEGPCLQFSVILGLFTQVSFSPTHTF